MAYQFDNGFTEWHNFFLCGVPCTKILGSPLHPHGSVATVDAGPALGGGQEVRPPGGQAARGAMIIYVHSRYI
jgi:hypothetical protein